ncbi:MAG: hypothetical protein ACJAUD_001096 [Crocinitomicaceae bacterium]|jgi:hypothetical protein
MKVFTIIKRIKVALILKQALLFFSINIIFTSTLFSQENPWESTPQGENPWVTQETVKQETTPAIKLVEIGAEGKIILIDSNETATAASKSTSTHRYFNFNGTEVMLNAKSYNYSKQLRNHGKSLHKANGAMAAGIVTGSIASFYAAPVNIVASVIPTFKSDQALEHFRRDNPHATAEEIALVKKGIRQKRVARAMIGNGIGMVINLGIIVALIL